MAWDRKERLEALIKEKVAIIVLERLNDPRLGFVTITGVQLSRDKRHAKVLYTVLGTPNQRRTTERALQDAARHVQEQLAPTLRLRTMPELRFTYDESIEKESRMLDLLDDIATRRRAAGHDVSLADAEAAEGAEAGKAAGSPENEVGEVHSDVEGASSEQRQSDSQASSSASEAPADDSSLTRFEDPETDANDPSGTPRDGDPRDDGRDSRRRAP